jgi:DNA-binding MarR family transcriptional regulator
LISTLANHVKSCKGFLCDDAFGSRLLSLPHVQCAARALARRFDDALRPLDLTSGQFSLLMSLNRAEPPAMAAVASLLAMDRTTLTAALKPLERRGLVTFATDPRDRRTRLMALAPKGMTLLAKAIPIWERTHQEVESLLPDRDPNRLRSNLRILGGGGKNPR